MIVRDNERTIRAALESIRPWVDEMIVVDTGSTDATPEICRELGARVYHLPWPDSFSVARNESLKHARGEWIFWMDSDDVIDADNGRKLRQLVVDLANAPPGPPIKQKDGLERPSSLLGYVMQVHCPGPGEDGRHNVTVVDHVKLFRNRADLRFEGRVHEQVLEAITIAVPMYASVEETWRSRPFGRRGSGQREDRSAMEESGDKSPQSKSTRRRAEEWAERLHSRALPERAGVCAQGAGRAEERCATDMNNAAATGR